MHQLNIRCVPLFFGVFVALVGVFVHSVDAATDTDPITDRAGRSGYNSPRRPHPGGPLASFVTKNFAGSGRCAVCHERLVDGAGNDVSISNHWRSTMMANAANDPLWQAKVASEVARNPALKAVIETKCATCHMPMAWTQAYAAGEPRAVFDNGFLASGQPLHDAAMDGVSCTLCHQVRDSNLGSAASFSGKFQIDTDAVGRDRKIFGPFRQPRVKAMQTSVEFTPAFGPQTNDSALCATCHTLFTPYVDAMGKIAGEFPEQTPYLEWQHSDYNVAATDRREIGSVGKGMLCQDCHMPHAEAGEVMIARYAPPGTKAQDHFSRHHFVGGNVVILGLLRDNIAGLGLTASTANLTATLERTRTQLQKNSAGMAIVEAGLRGNTLNAVVRVENKAGHKFPTGIPLRKTWIHFRIADHNGNVVFESGQPQANGTINGNDNDDTSASFEPHHEVITDQDQVQIYEAVMMDTDNEVTYTLLRAARYVKDNRLLPSGFDKTTAGADIAVYGRAAADNDFVGNSDQVTYSVAVTKEGRPFTVRAELLFAPVSPAFVKDLGQDDHLDAVKRFGRLYRRADTTPVTVAVTVVLVK